MMGRMNMGKQIATAPTSRIPLAAGMGRARPMAMKKGGSVKGYAKGGKIDGCCMRGKTKGKMC